MNFPFVLIDRHYPDLETDYVIADDRGGVEQAVEHLILCGTSKIGFVNLKSNLDALHNRFLGYKNTLEKHGILFRAEYVHELNQATYIEEMNAVFNAYQNEEESVEAIVFSTHYLAACGIREIRSRNLRVPEDYKIISYEENSTFDLIDPPVTAVKQPVAEIGSRAVEILLEKLNSEKKNPTQVVLKTGFVVRKSCGEE